MRKLQEWIEYMEGEGPLKNMSQLGLLLKHSAVDQMILDNLRRLRRSIKAADPANDIEEFVFDSEYLGEFHQKTMSAIENLAQKQQGERSSSLRPEVGLDSSLNSCKR